MVRSRRGCVLAATFALVGCGEGLARRAAPSGGDAGATPAGEVSEAALSSTGFSLVVRSASPGLAAEQWLYRETATRSAPGCYDYDVLQRTGWYPATWHRTYPFTPSATGAVVRLERTPRAAVCAARMDANNEVVVTLDGPRGRISGSFQVVPDGSSDAASARCARVETSFVDDRGATRAESALSCSDAHVQVPGSGAMTVTVFDPEVCRTCVSGGGGRACADRCEDGDCRSCVASGGGRACISRCG